MVDSTLAFDILARDHASSTFDKVARSADRTSVALKKSAKISDDVAKAEMRLSKARDGESDSMGRVRVAEERLQELRDRGLQGTSRFTAAEESLSSARRKAAQSSNLAKLAEDSLGKARSQLAADAESTGKEAGSKLGKGFGDELDKEGGRSGKRFGSSLKRWFKGDGAGLFAEIGKSGGTVFGSGILGALKTPILGPALVTVVGAAVATALPAVGAIAGGALVAGFGAGLAGLGIVFAAKSAAVQKKWASTMAQLGADMRLLSKPFESTLINIAGYFQRTVDKFNPVLGKAFAKMAPVVDKFVDGAARSLEQLIPAIGPIADAFGKVLDSMGPALQSAVGSLAKGMTQLALSVQKNPEALADTVKGIGDIVGMSLRLITILNDVNGSFATLTGGTSLVDVVMGGLKATMMPLITLFAGFGKVLDLTNAALGKTGKDSDIAGKSMADAANKTILLAQTAGLATGQYGKLSPAVETATTKFDRQVAATNALVTSLFRVQNLTLTLSGAQIGLEAAIDAAAASVKENGKTLDINTAKGRANKTALDGVASAANQQTEAMLKSGKGTSAAGLAAEKSRANFVKVGMQMGLSKKQAEAMAKAMIAVPNVSREAKLTANKKDLDTKLAAARAALKDPNLTKERKAKLNAEIAKLLAAKAKAQRAIDALHGKTVTVFMNTIITERRNVITSRLPIDGRAVGGPVKKGMPYIVGEKRPELFVPKEDGEIIPQVPRQSKAAAFGAASAGGTVNLLFKSDGSPYMEFLIKEFRKYIRVQGGDVQAVLGRG